MDINKIFISGRMNKDDDERYLKNGDYRDAQNIRVLTSADSEVGTVQNVQGNELLLDLLLTNAAVIGGIADDKNETIYYFVKADEFDAIYSYNSLTGFGEYILQSTTLLNFQRLRGVNLFDNLLFWTDGVNPPRMINIDRAKTWGLDGFVESDIAVIKAPPLMPPTIILTDTLTDDENNIEEKFLAFAYRFKYLDGEYSAMSPFTAYAFTPNPFDFDFSTSTNNAMINKYNQVEITYNTGGNKVAEIELLFKYSGSQITYVIDSFNKATIPLPDNSDETFLFDNSKIYTILPESEIYRMYDNVPLLAGAQESLGNRILYGDYTEFFDIKDCADNNIEIDYELTLNTQALIDLNPLPSLKSNRDYEIGIVYLEDYGRASTVQVSKLNTIFIPNANALIQNKIQVELSNPPPCFATKFRFFIKQATGDYDVLIPTLFYQDGVFVWIRMEQSDLNKVKVGDFLIVKADTTGLLTKAVETQILEITQQEENFLDPDEVDETLQIAALYYKIKPKGFVMNEEDFTNYAFQGYDNSREAYDDPIRNDADFLVYPAVFYGVGLNDGISGGIFSTSTFDLRYRVEISTVGAFDSFKYSTDDGITWSGETQITGVEQSLSNGVTITFINTSGHTFGDYWVIPCKTPKLEGYASDTAEDIFAFGLWKGLDTEEIKGGAVISLTYDESGAGTLQFQGTWAASKNYANIEEWYYGDQIYDQLGDLNTDELWFRKGICEKTTAGDGNAWYITLDETVGVTTMIMRSQHQQQPPLGERSALASKITIFQSDSLLVFETKPPVINTDIYYEIGETYDIVGDYHMGSIQDQSATENMITELDVFNCFVFGNAVESYKIKDAWNGVSMKMDTRPMAVADDYKNYRKYAALTYSGLYDKQINLNNLNEFNLSNANFKNLDEKWGAIGVIYNDKGNLLVIQEDSTSQVLYNKKALYDAEGGSTITTSTAILGSQRYFAGVYGISGDIHTFAVRGNRKYWTDSKRGAVMRLSADGLTEISRLGMFDWFKDYFRANLSQLKLGGYDPFYDEYILYLSESDDNYKTLSFNEVPKGWTSFSSFEPEFILNMNNEIYSFKNGNLYKHNSDIVQRQTFYGTPNDWSVTVLFNDKPDSDKVFKTFATQSSLSMNVDIVTNLTFTNLSALEFEQRESFYYAFLRQTENDNDYTGFNANGIGNINFIAGNIYSISTTINQAVAIGDVLWFDNGTPTEVGIITVINVNSVVVATVVNQPSVGDYIYSLKDTRIEGSEIRGYFLEAKIHSDAVIPAELNGVTINTILSNV